MSLTRLGVITHVSPPPMPFELSSQNWEAGCPGNCTGYEVVSFCRFPRTNKRCRSFSAQSSFKIDVFNEAGAGEENVYEPKLYPSPVAKPLFTGNCWK